MLDQNHQKPPIVFLHIPKTAGQSVHNALSRAVGADHVSPIRVHTQAQDGAAQFPDGYRLYSGHLDWTALDRIPTPRFVFSILRDPRERIASFYFYLRKEAKSLTPEELDLPQNKGKKAALFASAEEYFFGGDPQWQHFIRDHYDNFYCRYLASQRIRAGQAFSDLPDRRKLRMALRNLEQIDWIYSVENLSALEADLHTLFGFDLNLESRRDNAGDRPVTEKRWPRLLEHLPGSKAEQKLERFVELDLALMQQLEL